MKFPFLYRSFPNERNTLYVLVLTITFCHFIQNFRMSIENGESETNIGCVQLNWKTQIPNAQQCTIDRE